MTSARAKRPKRAYRQGARAESAAATRDAVVRAAVQGFRAKPYDLVSLADVAARANVTVQTVLGIFGSKELLFEAAVMRVAGGIIAEREAALSLGIADAIGALTGIYERHGEATHHLVTQESRVAAIRAIVEQGRSFHREWVRQLFEPHLVDAKKPRRRALAMLTALLDLETYRALRREGLDPTDARDALIEAATGAIDDAPHRQP